MYPPYEPPSYPSGQPNGKRPSRLGATLVLGAVLAGILYVLFMQWQLYSGQKAVEQWLQTTPVNALVLKEHPNTYPRFAQHFTPYIAKMGEAGLAEGQIELQQILIVNYLIDGIWYYRDKEIMDYLRAQYVVVNELLRLTKNNGTCERYFRDSSLYAEVRKIVGDKIFIDYMKAAEALMLSRTPTIYAYNPTFNGYRSLAARAAGAISRDYVATFPERADDNIWSSFDPIRNCAKYAGYLYVMAKAEPSVASLTWRASMEAGKAEVVRDRRLRGSE